MKKQVWNSKKNLSEIIKNNPQKRILFFDESRFGTKSQIGYGWFQRGLRTPVQVKQGFKNFYLYSAVESISGDDFTLLLPHVNTDCMNVFLKELSTKFAEEIILIMDGAGWHKSKDLVTPDNIQIIILPPYSPELNPVERLWKYIKDNILKNQIYETLEDLKNATCNFIKNLSTEIIKSICSTSMVNYKG